MSRLTAAIRSQTERRSDRVALVSAERQYSYRDLGNEWSDCARRLTAAGVRPGDRLFCQSSTHWDVFVLSLACMDLGVTIVPIHPAAGADWVDSLTKLVQPSLLATSLIDWKPAELSGAKPAIDPDVHTLILTSGTTGMPKGVPIHAAMTDAAAENAAELFQLSKSSTFLDFIPPMTVGGLFLAGLPVLASGATLLATGFSPRGFQQSGGASSADPYDPPAGDDKRPRQFGPMDASRFV